MSDDDVRRLANDMEIEIVGMRPKVVTQSHIKLAAEFAVEAIVDTLSERYGAVIDGDGFPEDAECAAVQRSLIATLTRVLRDARPWQCDQVSSYVYTGEELAKLVVDES
jgi:hypothetical protein